MTVPLRRLAGLWPWLLMAALQVVLGQPSMESGLRAVINVTLAKDPTGKPIVLKGEFVGGSAGNAQGKLKQNYPEAIRNYEVLTRHRCPQQPKKREAPCFSKN